jgi:lysophospholipase L1-like esterase
MRAAFIRRRWLFATLLVAFAVACGGSGAETQRSVYIALGDSLSEGVGASDPRATGFVALVHESLGQEFDLINLGHSGDTSQDLIEHGHLDDAISEIGERNLNDDPEDDVRLVTLEIGGNDLLQLYFSLVVTGICPDAETSLRKAECVEPLASVLSGFEPNLVTIVERLHAVDPQLSIVLLTLYNPFSGLGGPGEIGELSLEGAADSPFPDGVNDIIRALASERQLILADMYPLFEGRTGELISGDLIHPNDQGYRLMADAVTEALRP